MENSYAHILKTKWGSNLKICWLSGMEDEKWLVLLSFTKKDQHKGPQTSFEGEQQKEIVDLHKKAARAEILEISCAHSNIWISSTSYTFFPDNSSWNLIQNFSNFRIFQHWCLPKMYEIHDHIRIELFFIQCVTDVLPYYIIHVKSCLGTHKVFMSLLLFAMERISSSKTTIK